MSRDVCELRRCQGRGVCVLVKTQICVSVCMCVECIGERAYACVCMCFVFSCAGISVRVYVCVRA